MPGWLPFLFDASTSSFLAKQTPTLAKRLSLWPSTQINRRRPPTTTVRHPPAPAPAPSSS
ncbi:hypothetical protein VDGD_20603 [Verticillium dahliae]|nr:hypothetical protein VDGD_20603 [Verticillium dahliae]